MPTLWNFKNTSAQLESNETRGGVVCDEGAEEAQGVEGGFGGQD